jgi:hypothetical protein
MGSQGNSWWRRGELEETAPPPRDAAALKHRIERLERAYQAELTGSMSLNIRGTALAAASALAILLLAQFSAIWLDDNRWELSESLDFMQRYILLPGAVGALLLCLLAAVIAVWPSRHRAAELKQRLARIGEGDDAEEAQLLLGITDAERVGNERKARILRVASVPLGVAVVLIVAQSMIFAFDAQPVDSVRLDQPGEVIGQLLAGLPPPEIQQRLAELYAPLVYVHSDERFGPAEPTAFIDASALVWNRPRHDSEVAGRGDVEVERLGSGCGDAPAGCYSYQGYLARELTRPFHVAPERPAGLQSIEDRGYFLDPESSARAGDLGETPGEPVYYEFRTTRDGVAITYWLFYGYSQPHAQQLVRNVAGSLISHEGDWENIDVVLTADLTRPVSVSFYGHGHPQRRLWTDVCKLIVDAEDCRSAEPGHPIVYSALGSHASYPTSGGTKVCGPAGCACDEREPARAWFTWEPSGDVRPVRGEPWYGFGGAWGAAGRLADLTGPLGPSAWKLPSDPDPSDLQSTKPC